MARKSSGEVAMETNTPGRVEYSWGASGWEDWDADDAGLEFGDELRAGDAVDGVAGDDEAEPVGEVDGPEEAESLSSIGHADDGGVVAFKDGLSEGSPEGVVIHEKNSSHKYPSPRPGTTAGSSAESETTTGSTD